MEERLPLITMVISKHIADTIDNLSLKSKTLFGSLSGLCSFYSVDDFISFLFSDSFGDLIKVQDNWLEFEIGTYLDHTKTMQLITPNGDLNFIDNTDSGWYDGVFISNDKNEVSEQIKKWCGLVITPNSRYE
jgi:hypothetical protein